ncbi:MAG: GGDEF domain-containing protein [Treponema sp.]|nr:GGDEF domain-containing protein [Treponema sp.]
MFYAIISFLALILNLIINSDSLKNLRGRAGESKSEQKVTFRYNIFLIVSSCYFFVDIGWGLLYEHRHIDSLYPFLYFDCLLYFFFMFLSMLTWIHYIVAYLDKHDRKSKALLHAVWTMFALAIIYLIINCFHPFIFSFNDQHEYIIEPGRHIAFILQIALYLVTSSYMLVIALKSTDSEKSRYAAVGLSCFVMELLLICQILNDNYPSYAIGLIIGICIIHSFVEAGERKEKEIYDNIATSLAENYEAMYYINIETGAFREFSKNGEYAAMEVPCEGRDFYKETRLNIDKFVHPDDREFAKTLHQKETMLQILEDKKSYSYKYRLMINGKPKHFQFTMMRAPDGKHFIISEKNIEEEITTENMRLANQKDHVTFTQVAEILAVNYDVIYYVDAKDSSYISYECRNIYGEVDVQRTGNDFFADSKTDITNIVHKSDRDNVLEFVNKKQVASTLTNQKSCFMDYRIVAFKKTHYVRMTIQKTTDETHYIIGIENIDEEVKKEKQHLKALNIEKELARRDELTGVKNKTAYHELEKSVQSNIDNGMDYLPFGLVVCDTNDLKKINDSQGHVEGDEYIKQSAKLLCDIFVHSPVFRIGGDEFIVFLRGSDYSNKEALMKTLQNRVWENKKSNSGPVLASGFAEFTPGKDSMVTQIFDRADKAMYKNKRDLKK